MQMAKKSTPYILIAPAFLFLIFIIIFPFIFTIRNSFMNWNLQTSVAPAGFVGGANYRLVFQDPTFLAAIVNTLKLSFAGTIIEFALGLVVALLLYEGLKGTKKIRALLIMPVTVAPMIAGLIFRYLYDADGLIPFLLHCVGIGTPKQGILGNEHTVLWGVLLTDLWQWTPFFAIILLAGLQSISDEII
jgi:multiple sugar transport system permease protein